MGPRRIELLAAFALALALPGALCAAPQEEPRKGVDRFGDPLPANALARFGTTRLHHGGRVFSVAFSPDGKILASAGGDGAVRLWETTTGKEKQVFTFSNEQLTSVVFFKDGKTLAASSLSGSIHILETATGKVKRSMTGAGPHSQSRTKLVLHPHNQILYCGSADGTVKEWDAENAKESRSIAAYRGAVTALALSSDGKTLAAASSQGGGEVHLYETDNGKELRQLPWGKGQILDLVFTADGNALAMGGFSNTLALYDLENGKEIQSFRSNNLVGMVTSVALSPSGKILASAINGPDLLLWGATSGKELRRLEGAATGADQIAYSPDGKMVAAACMDSVVRLWDVESGKAMHSDSGLPGPVQAIRFLADSKTLVASDTSRNFRSWDAASREDLGRLPGSPAAALAAWSLAPDGKSIVYAGHDRGLHFWDPVAGKELRKVENVSQFVTQSVMSQDGNTLAINEYARMIRIHNLGTGKYAKTFTAGPKQNPNLGYNMGLSPDGRRLTIIDSGAIHVWDIGTGTNLWKADQNTSQRMQHFVFSPDGKTLAVVNGFQIQILEVASQQERLHIDRLADAQNAMKVVAFTSSILAYSPDGAVLAAGRPSGEITLLDVASGTGIGKLTGHRGGVQALSFSSDGRLLASGGSDTTVLVWDVANLIQKSRPTVAAPSAAELAALWQDLAGDPVKAHRAIWMTTADPKKTVDILKGRLEPTDAKRIAKLVAELGSDDFETREKASQALANLPEADEAMKKALDAKPSLEMRRRIEAILDGRKPGAANAEQVREARAIEALELVGSAEARQLLEKLAKGPGEATLTQDAKAALDRLSRKEKK